jgi:hypothetical protein
MYNCPDAYSPDATLDNDYKEAIRKFENLYERGHQNKKKKDVELSLKT